MNYSGKKVIVMGAARQGLALSRYLAKQGAQVVLTDSRPGEALQETVESLKNLPVSLAFGGHPMELLDGVDLVCPSGCFIVLTCLWSVVWCCRGRKLSRWTVVFSAM